MAARLAARRLAARRPARGDVFVGVCLAVAVGTALWLSRGIWDDGIPRGADMGAHFVRAETAQGFFRTGRLDGWQARFGLGYQQSLFLGPGFNLVVAAVSASTLGLLSTSTAVKVAMVAVNAALPLAVAALAAAFGLPRRASGVAALLTLGVSVTLGGAGLAGLFVFSLVPNALGAVFTVLGSAGVVAVVRRPTVPRILFTAANLAAVFLTHPWSALVLGMFTAFFVGLHAVERLLARDVTAADGARRVLGLAVALGGGAVLAGIQLVPVVAHRDLKVTNASFADAPIADRLAVALRGDDYLWPGLAVVVLAGLAFAGWRAWRRRPLALPLALLPVVWILVARGARVLMPGRTVAVQLMNRSLFLVVILGVVAAAGLLAEAGPAVAGLLARRGVGGTAAAVAAAAVGIGLPLALVTIPRPPPEEHVTTVAPEPALQHAADELRRRVPDSGRYLVQRGAPTPDARENGWPPYLWLAWASGRNSLNVFNIESSAVDKPVYEGDDLGDVEPDVEAGELIRYGVTHVLVFEPDRARDLLASPRFRTVWREGPITLVEVLGPDGAVSPVPVVSSDVPTTGTVRAADPEHPVFDLGPGPARRATLAVGWSPKWSATVDGRAVPLGRDRENLLTVDLPEGGHTLALSYGADAADGAGLAVTLLAVAGAVALAVQHRRRDRPLPLVARLVNALDPPGPPVPAPAEVEPDAEPEREPIPA
jgi:hypothetical protein